MSDRSDVKFSTSSAEVNSSLSAATAVTNGNSQSVRVLLVEDNVTAQKVTQAILASLNCITDIADCGMQALALFAPGKYQLILMDIGLPDISGYSVTNQMRQLESRTKYNTPIISLTAHADHFTENDYAKMGIKEAVTKPLSKEIARQLINKYASQPMNNFSQQNPEQDSEFPVIEEGADKEILDLLTDSLKQSANELEIAYQTKDIPGLTKIVHKLHGGLCYSNTPQLRNAACELETSLQNNEIHKLQELYQNFLQAKRNFIVAYQLLRP